MSSKTTKRKRPQRLSHGLGEGVELFGDEGRAVLTDLARLGGHVRNPLAGGVALERADEPVDRTGFLNLEVHPERALGGTVPVALAVQGEGGRRGV